MTTFKNNHYAQKAIIKNWSDLNHQGHRSGKVWVLDFVTGKFECEHVDRVYARDSLFTPDEEQRFNVILEQPLAKFCQSQLRNGIPSNEKMERIPLNGKTGRAVTLFCLVASSRFFTAYAHDKGLPDDNLAQEFACKTDDELYALARLFREKFQIFIVFLREPPMFYPELGMFLVPLDGHKKPLAHPGTPLAWALPLSPYMAVVVVPNAWTFTGKESDAWHEFSVGIGQSRSVIVPAELITSEQDKNQMIEHAINLRKRAERRFAQIRQLAEMMGHDVSGLPKGPSWPA
jgi:hypothetical protein